MRVIPALVIMVLNTRTIACFAMFSYVGIMESRKLIGRNMAKMINSIWENIIMPVSRKTNIVIPRLKISRKNTIPRRLMTCGIVRLSLSLSSISSITTSSLVSPSSSDGLAETRASTRSEPISSISLLPNCKSNHGCCTCMENRLSLIRSTLSLPLLSLSGSMIFVPKSSEAVEISLEKSFIFLM